MDKIPIRNINAPQKELNFSESFSIRDVQALLAGKDMVQELHRHDFFYILALKKGSGNHDIDFMHYTICDNSVFYMRPGQVHRLDLKAGSTGCLLQFRDDFFFPDDHATRQLLRKAGKASHFQLNADRFKKLVVILSAISREYAGKEDGHREVIKAYLGIFFIALFRQQNSRPSGTSSLYKQERLAEFLTLLEKHAFSHKQVAEYAAMMHVSAYQLNAITKETLGKTCTELINEHIILEAKRYLLATSNQVNQIAELLGYEDASYFIRFFKKHTSYSPEAFRNNLR
jgi:AraC-like DNA-binding protein